MSTKRKTIYIPLQNKPPYFYLLVFIIGSERIRVYVHSDKTSLAKDLSLMCPSYINNVY